LEVHGGLHRKKSTFSVQADLSDPLIQFIIISVPVGKLSGGEEVAEYAAAPDVPTDGDCSVEALGRHVQQGPVEELTEGSFLFAEVHGDSEIDEFDLYVVDVLFGDFAYDDHVIELDIAVEDMLIVHVADCREELHHYAPYDGLF
jgi:hypothetical protein